MHKSVFMSAVPPLYPIQIIDASSGEIVDNEEFHYQLSKLSNYVLEESTRLWEYHKNSLCQTLSTINSKSPGEAGRLAGIHTNVQILPREIKAKSRIERLIRYQVITNARSYYGNTSLVKREPSFSPLVHLAAVDTQMASINLENSLLNLTFKCWSREFIVIFRLPDYLLKRNIRKISLPTIKQSGQDLAFLFTAEEITQSFISESDYIAGIDLGRKEPYTLVIVHEKTRKRVAQYTASKRLRILANKRDRINEELGFLQSKSHAYRKLGIDNSSLENERNLTRAKRQRINNKITWLIASEINSHILEHKPRLVSMEDLTWTNPKFGMSRWTHSKDQTAIIHKLTRSGFLTKKVNPKNTSQNCSKCGEKITHLPGRRLVVCKKCVLTIDRDINAAINIACRPLSKRKQGINCTALAEVKVNDHSIKICSTSIENDTS